MRTLILGCGYLGRRVADRRLAAGHEIAALTRSAARAAELRAVGIAAVVGDVADAASLAALPPADVAVYAVGFDRGGGRGRREVVIGGLANALAALAGKTPRLVFLSTTGVYGQSDGAWVDEGSPTEPDGESGRLAVEAEGLLGATAASTVVLRLSGLYGPGRLLRRVEQLRSGEPIAGDGEAWLNLIHVDDAAAAVIAAADRLLALPLSPSPPRVFLVSDDRPVRRREYYGWLAELTGSPSPAFDPAAESRTAGLGKRCRNDRAKRDLGLSLAFPTFEEGLADAVRRS